MPKPTRAIPEAVFIPDPTIYLIVQVSISRDLNGDGKIIVFLGLNPTSRTSIGAGYSRDTIFQ